MHLLVIDTATNSGGVALSRNSEVIGSVMLKTPQRYSDNLIFCIEFLFRETGVTWSDVNGLVVAAGPGSFTGLRIGIAAAKAFGQACSIPAVGLSTLEALAFRFRHAAARVAPWLDARRQQIFAATYKVTDSGAEPLSQPWVGAPAEWLKMEGRADVVFVGDAATLYRSSISAHLPNARVLTTDNHILESMCLLGYRKFAADQAFSAEDLRANYVRPPDAEMSRLLRSYPIGRKHSRFAGDPND